MVSTNDEAMNKWCDRSYGLNEFLCDINKLKDKSNILEEINIVRDKWLHDKISGEAAMREIQYIMTK